MTFGWFGRAMMAGLLAAAWVLGVGGQSRSWGQDDVTVHDIGGGPGPAPAAGGRTLVIIVPGNPGARQEWATAIPGQATFASELRRAAGPDTEIYPFLWNGAEEFRVYDGAGRALADEIDRRGHDFDHVDIVGHGFGGDIALRAAGLTRQHIDIVVNLSTPNAYIDIRGDRDHAVYAPIFCDYHARENIRSIINVSPGREDLPSGWDENFAIVGLTRREALPLVDPWRDHLDDPRFRDDELVARTGHLGDIFLARRLDVADENVRYQSDIPTWTDQHALAHSRRMGAVVGELIHDGASPERIDYLKTLIQPREADRGGPVPEDEQRNWDRDHEEDFHDVGYRLEHITVETLRAGDRAYQGGPGGRRELSVALTVRPPGAAEAHLETAVVADQDHAEWSPDWILHRDDSGTLSVRAGRRVIDAPLRPGQPPRASIPADPPNGIFVTTTLDWAHVHY